MTTHDERSRSTRIRRTGLASLALLVAVALLAAAPTGRAEVNVGQLKAIVTAPDPAEQEQQAAKELARYLKRMYGVDLKVEARVAIGPDTTNVILLGSKAALAANAVTEAELRKLRWDGYVIGAGGGRMFVAGPRPLATLFGVAGLLEHLGAEFYGFTEVVPEKKAKTIADFRVSDKPAFDLRVTSKADWRLKNSSGSDFANAGPVAGKEIWPNRWHWREHTAGYLVPKTIYYDEHPEYYAMLASGKRIAKDKFTIWRTPLCLSNPDVTRISIERMRAWIKDQPEARFFSLTYGDTMTHCQCPECKKLDAVPGQYMDRKLHWVNGVAKALGKEYPDKVFITYAYVNTDHPPQRLKPAENVLVLYAPWYGRCANCRAHPYDTCWASVVAARQMEDWTKCCPDNLGIYDYGVKIAQLRSFEHKIKFWAKRGHRGFMQCGWGSSLRSLQNYVIPKLLWDPTLDAKKLERDFCRAYYGPAGDAVADYIDLWYHEWVETGSHQIRGQRDYPRRARALLTKARQAVQGMKTYEARLNEERGIPAIDSSNVYSQAAYKAKVQKYQEQIRRGQEPQAQADANDKKDAKQKRRLPTATDVPLPEPWGADAEPVEPELGFQGYDHKHLWLSEPQLGRGPKFKHDAKLTRIDAIVAPRQANAAAKLQSTLQAVYGIKVPIKDMELTAETRGVIAVGREAALATGLIDESDLKLAGPDGAVVRGLDGRVALAPGRKTGTDTAIDGLLYILRSRHGGVEALGDQLPKAKVPLLRAFTLIDTPPFGPAGLKHTRGGTGR